MGIKVQDETKIERGNYFAGKLKIYQTDDDWKLKKYLSDEKTLRTVSFIYQINTILLKNEVITIRRKSKRIN